MSVHLSGRLSLENAPVINTSIPGPKSKQYLEIQDRLETSSRSYTGFFKFAIDYGKGSTVVDLDGNVFIDWFAGVSVMNLGHGHPAVLQALRGQIDRITHITEVPTEARINYLKKLNSLLPGKMRDNSKIFMTVSGADACEAAVSLARYNSKKPTIIAFSGSYHGIAGGIVGATSNFHYREFAGFASQNYVYAPYPYAYRYPGNVSREDISKDVIGRIEEMIRDPYSGVPPVGGIIVEPVQGEGGYIVPPDDFLPMLRETCDDHSIPLIIDEVQSGIGRTGKVWASEYQNVTPDIMCISKSIGGGIPISSIAYRKDFDQIPKAFHLGTYRGNPLGLAAGAAVLDIVKEDSFLQRVRSKGKYVLERFEEIQEKSSIIGEARGRGFMIAAEIVKNKKDKSPGTELAGAVRDSMFQKGVLMHTCGHYGNTMRFMAPLTIEDDLLEKGISIFEESIRETEVRS
ncbi:MAG: aspartate aminotransferase family protein [Candidatus Thermoplasmatota archaeon]|jgi:4-aminobutyrate aminotransferase|nr:aspartate aminotransferase family protein [Candidatus Thermoplasmatota archaeon]MCL5789986.1 aspartate aminotransferase family protein [Candidatus Thermoplasmatota archaeon]